MSLGITIFLILYFGIGFVYAMWIFLFGYDRWYVFPVNWFLGLPVLLLNFYFVATGKKNPFGKY